jgi:hypothetical protein
MCINQLEMSTEQKKRMIKIGLLDRSKYTQITFPYEFEKFMDNVRSPEMFGKELNGHDMMTLHYVDQDGDRCGISTDSQFQYAMDISESIPLKIIIHCPSYESMKSIPHPDTIVLPGFKQTDEHNCANIEYIASKVIITKETAGGMSRDQLSAKFCDVPELKAIGTHLDQIRADLLEFKDDTALRKHFSDTLLRKYVFSHNMMTTDRAGRISWRIIKGHGTNSHPIYSWAVFTISAPTDVTNGLLGIVAAALQIPFTILATVCSAAFAFNPTSKYIDANCKSASNAFAKLGIDAFQVDSHNGTAWKSIIQSKGLIQLRGPPDNRRAVIEVN